MHELIIIGSGAAGAWAAWQAARRGLRPLMLDAGLEPGPEPPLQGSLHALRRSDPEQARWLLGERFESLNNLHRAYLSPKLKAPRFAFVTARTAELAPTLDQGFHATQSLALGGLANAWGASVHRYDDQDLRAFPFKRRDLDPYYDALAAEIGVSGAEDDLSEGGAGGLQPPLRADPLAARLLRYYERHRPGFLGLGLRLGRPRLALLSQEHQGRAACAYDNLAFWQPGLPSLYTPAMTVRSLRGQGKLDYQGGWLVEGFRAGDAGVTVQARRLEGGQAQEFRARRLLLAAGALGSARLVLRSFSDTRSRLPLLENPTTLTPFFHPAAVGAALPQQSHGLAQLNAFYEGPAWDGRVKGAFYSYTSALAADLFADLPLAAGSAAGGLKALLPALLVLQLFYRDEPHSANYLSLDGEGRLLTHRGHSPALGAVERRFRRALLPAGFLSLPGLSKALPAGNGIHYAGTLPISTGPAPAYRCDAQGRLAGAPGVHVADASLFPELPAKNHGFTLMALAMRVADAVADELGAAA